MKPLGTLAAVATIWIAPLLVAQAAPAGPDALLRFLGLSDAEIARLHAEGTLAGLTLNSSQKARLDEVARVLDHAYIFRAVELGLIDADRWPGGYLCYDEPSYLGLHITAQQFDELRGLKEGPKAPRLAVLTDVQRERLASYEAQLELVHQAIELGWISKRPFAEPLCH